MLMTGVGGKDTIDKSIDRLVEVGLLEKAKGYKGNNIYRVYKPLERSELYKYVPDMVKELNAKKIKLGLQAEQEKARLQIWQQEQQEKEIEARQVVPQWV
jgi:predicted transcriptional regulator